MSESNEAVPDLRGLKVGDPQAIERLWADYFQRLVGLARHFSPRIGGELPTRKTSHSVRFTACARALPRVSFPNWTAVTIFGDCL